MSMCFIVKSGRGVLVMALMWFMSGCVSNTKHQDLLSRYDELQSEKLAGEQNCENKIKQMTQQIADLDLQKRSLQQQRQAEAAQAEEMKSMVNRLRQNLASQQARVMQLEKTLKIEVVDKLMFESGSTNVSKEGSKILAQIAPVLSSAEDKEIIVVGHADYLPPNKELAQKYPSNWELSAARAASIVHILTWEHKIDPSRMAIQGAAHYRPLTSSDVDDDDYRKANRVVEIILKPKVP